MAAKKNSISKIVDEPVNTTLYVPYPRYEYIRVPSNSIHRYNELGADGWKLITENGRDAVFMREIL